MKLRKCVNGHFYDEENYDRCPYCEQIDGHKNEVPCAEEKTMGFYSMEQRGQILESEERTPAYSPQYDCEEQSGQPRREEADFWMSQNEYGQESESEDYDRESPELKTSPEYGYRQSSQGYCPEYQNPYGGYADRYNPMPPQGDFGGQPQRWGTETPDEDNRTVGYYSRRLGTEPVVGWLVCVEGTCKGESFSLITGRFFVGRGPDMVFVLRDERGVSWKRHAIIVYEPRENIFIAQTGDSRELFYVNDEVVLDHIALQSYDVLSIGNTKLLFIALCGEKFKWDTFEK